MPAKQKLTSRFFQSESLDLWLLLLVSATWYLYLARDFFFIYDEWNWWRGLVDQPIGSNLLFTPYVDSLNGGLFLIWKFLTSLFGMNYLPYQAVTLVFFCFSVITLRKICTSLGLSREMTFVATLCFSFVTPNVGNVLFGWQMAWTAGITLGLGALYVEINNQSKAKSLQATFLVALGIFIGPAALPFLVSLSIVCLISRKFFAVMSNLGVGALWLYWKTRYPTTNSVTDGFPLSILEGPRLKFISEGISASLEHLWPIAAILLVGLLARWRQFVSTSQENFNTISDNQKNASFGEVFTAPSKSMLILLAGVTGLISWWLMLSAGRSQTSEEAIWANADQFRYQHVSCVFLTLLIITLVPFTNFNKKVVAIAVILIISLACLQQISWATPYRDYASSVKEELCHASAAEKVMNFSQEEISRYAHRGWLNC